MAHKAMHVRPGLTATAAILALLSTPSPAQEPGSADAATEAPTTVEPDPLAPEATPEAAVAPPPAPRPKVEAPPAPRPKVETARAEPSPATTARPPASRPAQAVSRPAVRPIAAAAPAPADPAASAADASTPVAPPPVAKASPPAEPAPEPAASSEESLNVGALLADERLPYAGGAAAGLLAAGGLAMAMRRRRRRREEEELQDARWAIIDAPAEPAPEPELELQPEQQLEAQPAFARPAAPRHDPTPPVPEEAQPDELDLSRFGRHVQAAYRGPTPDNPSVSLEYRLRKASMMDQREKDAAEAAARAAKVPMKGNWESRSDADFLFWRGEAKDDAKKPEYQQ